MRQKFEANRHVTNPKAIDVLILKGRQEYQETMNGWKMNDHVCGILLDSNTKRSRKGFLERFYEGKVESNACRIELTIFIFFRVGRDEQAVLPAASGVV